MECDCKRYQVNLHTVQPYLVSMSNTSEHRWNKIHLHLFPGILICMYEMNIYDQFYVTQLMYLYYMHHQYNASVWFHGPLARCVKLRVAHAPGMPGTFSPPPRVSDPDMHHDTVLWCMSGSLTNGFLWSRWQEKRSRLPGVCVTHNFTYLARGPYTGTP